MTEPVMWSQPVVTVAVQLTYVRNVNVTWPAAVTTKWRPWPVHVPTKPAGVVVGVMTAPDVCGVLVAGSYGDAGDGAAGDGAGGEQRAGGGASRDGGVLAAFALWQV